MSAGTAALTYVTDVDDSFTEAQHANADKEIAKFVKELFTVEGIKETTAEDILKGDIRAQCLLMKIVSTCDLLDQQFECMGNAELASKNENLRIALSDAFKQGKYAKVRRIEFLRADEEPRNTNKMMRLHGLDSAVKKAWKQPYIGKHHVKLYNYINSVPQDADCSNVVSIVQSSGAGKTRMAHEMGRLVFTIYLNFGESYRDRPYPLADNALTEALLQAKYSSNLFDIRWMYADFFRKLYDAAREDVLEFEHVDEYSELLELWNSTFEVRRKRLYERAIKDLKKSMKVDHKLQGRALYDHIRDQHCVMYAQMVKALLSLQKALRARVRNKSSIPWRLNHDQSDSALVRLVVCIDGAHTLAVPLLHPGQHEKTLLDCIYWTLSDCRSAANGRAAMIALSTKSLRMKTTEPPKAHASSRIVQGPLAMPAPFTDIPFDCHPSFLTDPGKLCLNDLCGIHFMSRFGRPLFWGTLENVEELTPKTEEGLLKMAEMKLLNTYDVDAVLRNTENTDVVTAVLDVRLMLAYEPTRQSARDMQDKLVKNHMRIAYSVPALPDCIRSRYPSEPLLAEAAARQMSKWRSQNKAQLPMDHLTWMAQDGMLDVGERGELVARYMATVAYDNAVDAENKTGPVRYSQGCGLITFIKELFTTNVADAMMRSVPTGTTDGRRFNEAFAESVVRFTHWGTLGDNANVNTHLLYSAFVRGVALCGRISQLGLVLVVPVLLDKKRPVGETAMTALLIQVRHRKARRTTGLSGTNATLFRSQEDAEQRELPYVTFAMDLSPLESEVATSERNVDMKDTTKARRFAKPNHPHYDLDVRECLHTVYKVIQAGDEERYRIMLGTGSFLSDHRRRSYMAHRTILAMKPFWSDAADSFDWTAVRS